MSIKLNLPAKAFTKDLSEAITFSYFSFFFIATATTLEMFVRSGKGANWVGGKSSRDGFDLSCDLHTRKCEELEKEIDRYESNVKFSKLF